MVFTRHLLSSSFNSFFIFSAFVLLSNLNFPFLMLFEKKKNTLCFYKRDGLIFRIQLLHFIFFFKNSNLRKRSRFYLNFESVVVVVCRKKKKTLSSWVWHALKFRNKYELLKKKKKGQEYLKLILITKI